MKFFLHTINLRITERFLPAMKLLQSYWVTLMAQEGFEETKKYLSIRPCLVLEI
jgi:hypothetical protein